MEEDEPPTIDGEIIPANVSGFIECLYDNFEYFQERLRKEKPDNWERDIKLIDQLKKNMGELFDHVWLKDTVKKMGGNIEN